MPEYIAAEAAVLMVPSMRGFRSRLKTALKTVDEAVQIGMELAREDVAKTAAEVKAFKELMEKDEIDLKVRLDSQGITRRLTEIRHTYENLGRQFYRGLTLNLKVVGIQLLPQVAQGLAAVNASLVELTQSALVLPAVLSGVAGALGTVLTGATGLVGAFRELGDMQKKSEDAAKRNRTAMQSLQSAQRDLARATREARRQLEDLHDEMRDAPLDEAEAILDLRDAQAEMADTFGKTALQRQRDALRLQRAEANLQKVQRGNVRLYEDYSEAVAKGVEGADAVVAANERLAKAQEDLDDADALKGFNDALKNLSPNAQAFAQAVRGMSDEWKSFRHAVQDRLFAGMDAEVARLATQLPLLERGFSGIADGLNENVRAMVDAFTSDDNTTFLERIFGNTADAQRLFSDALTPFLDSFLHLSAVGSDFMPRLSSGFATVLDRFDKFVERADEDGSLEAWIDRGMTAAADLGNSLINLGSIMNSVAVAFTGSGGQTFLELVEDSTRRLAEFLKSADGQDKLKTFFRDTRKELAEWKPILDDLPGLFKNLSDAAHSWVSMLMPYLRTFSSLLAEYPSLIKAILYAFLTWRTIGPILRGVKYGMEQLGGAIKSVSGKIGENRTSGLRGFVGGLAKALGPQLLLGAASGLTAYMAGQFIAGMDESTGALERQRVKAKELANTLDEVTAAATAASQALVIEQWQDAENSVTQEQYGNIVPELRSRGVDAQALSAAVASGDRERVEQLLSPIKGATAADVEQTEFWKRLGGSVQESGLSSADVAAALNGDRNAISRFEDWSDKFANYLLEPVEGLNIIPDLSRDALRGAERAGLVDRPDLLDWKNQLPENVQRESSIRGTVEEQLVGREASGDRSREANRTQYGDLSLNPAGASLFGPDAVVGGSAYGVTIHTQRPISDQLRSDIIANGGSVKVPGDGPDAPLQGALIELRRNRAQLYLDELPAAKTGGMLRGPGSGTSDSILARVSNGEFVIRADSVKKYGAGFFHALNSGELPAFNEGGLIDLPFPLPGGIPGESAIPPPFSVEAASQPMRAENVFKSAPDITNPGLYDPVTGGYTPVSGGSAHAGSGAAPGQSQVHVGTGSPPGITDVHRGSGAAPGPGGAPNIPYVPAAPSGVGPVAGGFDARAASLPDNLQPQTILQKIGEVLLEAFLGFFGLDRYYIDVAKQALGLVPQSGGGAGDPRVAQILGEQDARDALFAATDPTVGAISAGLSPAAQRAIQFAQERAVGQAYQYGGVGREGQGFDCSGIASAVYAAATGKQIDQRHFTTESDFEALGFVPGYKPGALNVGIIRGGGGPNSHMAVTLPNGVNVESGGAHGTTAYGGPAKGATDFPLQYYLPLEGYRSGGMIRGPGSGTSDSILARLSNGEYVVRAKSVDKYGVGFLNAVNEGRLPAFNEGGVVLPWFQQEQQQQAQPYEAQVDPRGQMQQAQSLGDGATLPALEKGIRGAASAVGNVASTAAGIGSQGLNAVAPGAGPAASTAAQHLIGGATQVAGDVITGLVEVVSSLGVGTLTPGTTAGPYGAPLVPERQNSSLSGPRVVNNYSGGIHVGSYEEFHRGQQRREAQQAQPFLTRLG